MKARHLTGIILLVLIADQALKIYIKTHYFATEEHAILGSWFRLHFIENEGMAWGWALPTAWGKIALTIFRLIAVIFGTWFLGYLIKKKYHNGLLVCAALVYAGALGNLIDSMFYGLIFEESSYHTQNIAKMFPAQGYERLFYGRVVDMLYFPILENKTFPSWLPIWGGQQFTFFSPVFNLADAAISTGVITIFLFQKRFTKVREVATNHPTVETSTTVDDNVQVQ